MLDQWNPVAATMVEMQMTKATRLAICWWRNLYDCRHGVLANLELSDKGYLLRSITVAPSANNWAATNKPLAGRRSADSPAAYSFAAFIRNRPT